MSKHGALRKVACSATGAALFLTGVNTVVAQETVVQQPPALGYQQNSDSGGIDLLDAFNLKGGEVQKIDPYFPPSMGGNPEDGISSNAIVDKDERNKVSDTTDYPYSAIVLFFNSGQKPDCSGALIGEDTILTAAHCLIDKNKKIKTGYTFCPGAYVEQSNNGGGSSGGGGWWGSSSVHDPKYKPFEEDGSNEGEGSSELFGFRYNKSSYTTPFGCTDATSAWWDHDYEPGNKKNIHGDIALVHLRKPLGKSTGYFGLSSTPVNGTKVNVTGYPGDKLMSTQWSNWSYDTHTEGDILRHGVDTYYGQSGSPVYNDDHYIVAAHDGSLEDDINFSARITPERLSYFTRLAREGGW